MDEKLEKIKEEENEALGTENLDTENLDVELDADLERILSEASATGDTLTPSEVLSDAEGEVQSEEIGNATEEAVAVQSESENSEPLENTEEKPVEKTAEGTAEKMFTQSQVNEMVGKARQEGRLSGQENALKELFARYGVNNDEELNTIFGKGQTYDDLNDDYSLQGESYKKAMAENALLKTHIDEDRWDDVKLILGGKGLEVSSENIEALIPTHPEWRKNTAVGNGAKKILNSPEELENVETAKAETKPITLKKLGNEVSDTVVENDQGKAMKLFGL